MRYGDRIRSPLSMFPSEYVEMRCFGSCRENCIQAILYRLFEAAGEEEQGGNRLISLVPEQLTRDTVAQIAGMMKEKRPEKERIWEMMCNFKQELQNRFQLNPENPSTFAPMSQAGEFQLNLLNVSLGSARSSLEVVLKQHKGTLFALYSAFTFDSFVDFPCGHFDLKYDYFKALAAQFPGKAVNIETMRTADMRCKWCQNDVSDAICSVLMGNEATFTDSDGGKCEICKRNCENRIPGRCKIHNCCEICYVKNYLTENYGKTPCCKQKLSDSSVLMLRNHIVSEYKWAVGLLELVKHDKKVKIMNRLKQVCVRCGKNYVLSQTVCEECRTLPPCPVPPKPRICTGCRQVVTDSAGTKCVNCSKEKLPGEDRQLYERRPPLTRKQLGEGNCMSEETEEEAEVRKPNEGMGRGNERTGNRSKSSLRVGARDEPALERVKSTEGTKTMARAPPGSPQFVRGGRRWLEEGKTEENKQEAGHEEAKKRVICAICGVTYTGEDEKYFCPNRCFCMVCSYETYTGRHNQCGYCFQSLSDEVYRQINKKYSRCHVCGIAVPAQSMEPAAKCALCMKCVKLVLEHSWIGPDKLVGTCRVHNTKFKVGSGVYRSLMDAKKLSTTACCSISNSTRRPAPCGHLVCRTHQSHLKFCRTCQKPTSN